MKKEIAENATKIAKKTTEKPKTSPKAPDWQLGDPVDVEKLIGTLATSAILLKLEIKSWRGTGSDKELTKEFIGTLGGLPEGFGSLPLKFLPTDIRSQLQHKLGKMQKMVRMNGLPWGQGWTLIPSVLYEPLKQALEMDILQARQYIHEITQPDMYQLIVEFAKKALGKAWSSERIPPPDEIREKFQVSIKRDTVNLPTKIEHIGDSALEEMRQDMMDDYANRYQSGILDIIEGLRETLQELVKQLEGSQDRDKYNLIVKMAESRIEDILRVDVFESKRVRRALVRIMTDVVAPLKENAKKLKRDAGERNELLKKTKAVLKDELDGLI